jgi:prephenate dehydrogenase
MSINTIAIIGCGLLGCSFSASLKKANSELYHIIGIDQNIKYLNDALDLGLIDEIVTLKEGIERADLIFISVPVGVYEYIFIEIEKYVNNSKVIITDVGSTKQNVIDVAKLTLKNKIKQYIPGHPIAGTHESGPIASISNLFNEKRVILTPLIENDPNDIEKVKKLWIDCGVATVDIIDPNVHDEVLASISHFPHWLSFLYMQHINKSESSDLKLSIAGTGFRDFTRISASSPDMWTDIFINNKQAMKNEIKNFRIIFDQAEIFLDDDNSMEIKNILTESSKARSNWK